MTSVFRHHKSMFLLPTYLERKGRRVRSSRDVHVRRSVQEESTRSSTDRYMEEEQGLPLLTIGSERRMLPRAILQETERASLGFFHLGVSICSHGIARRNEKGKLLALTANSVPKSLECGCSSLLLLHRGYLRRAFHQFQSLRCVQA